MNRALLAVTALVVCAAPAFLGAPDAVAADPECGPEYSGQTPPAFAALGIEDAWAISHGRGQSVTVAVLDTGVDVSNDHVKGAWRQGIDVTDAAGDAGTDPVGTGTAIAAQIAARKLPNAGLEGVAPEATILPVRIFSPKPNSADADIDPGDTADGINWAAGHGAQIIVVPRSSPTSSPGLEAAVVAAARRGALIVASSGDATGSQDAGSAARYPAAIKGVLAVAAVDSSGQASKTSVHNSHVGIAGPGQNVLTAVLGKGDCLIATDQPSTMYATAYVAGVAALVASAYPEESPAQWANRLQTTASRPLAIQPVDDRTMVGWGIVSPFEALNFVDDGTAPGPANPQGPAKEVQPPVVWQGPAPDPLPEIRAIVGTTAGATAVIALALALIKKAAGQSHRRRNADSSS